VATMVLRFYGRFVFAQPHKGGKPLKRVNILAVDPTFNPDVRGDEHRFLMTAPRRAVSTDGTRPADFVAMSSQRADRAEYLGWDFSGSDVIVAPANEFELREDDAAVLLSLNDLTGNSGKLLPIQRHSEGSTPAVTGVVRLGGGVATPRAIEKKSASTFVTFADRFNEVRFKNRSAEKPPADYVEVVVQVTKNLEISLARTRQDPVSSIVIDPDYRIKTDEGEEVIKTIVSFSNLCGASRSDDDAEFASLYDVLTDPPPVRDRFIPRHERAGAGTRGIRFDCYSSAYVAYDEAQDSDLFPST
jgi:hypothetical protein